MTEPLVGHIVYRSRLAEPAGTKAKKRKRNEQPLATQQPHRGVTEAASYYDDDEEVPVAAIAGWVFRPDACPEQESILSVPRSLLKRVCDAARFQQTVAIHSFAMLPLSHTSLGCGVQDQEPPLPLTLIEVHTDGLIVVSGGPMDATKRSLSKVNVCTLPQLAQREAVLGQRDNKQQLYSLSAHVHAISPVITMDHTDPFSLAELYDPDSTYTCVVVIRKDALQCQAALQPDDAIRLCNLKRQKWRIPNVLIKSFPHLQGRIPSHVFVVDQADQLQWDDAAGQVSSGGDDCSNVPKGLCSESTFPLELQGHIASVHMIRAGDQSHIHYIQVVSNMGPEPRPRHCLYVTYLPMSSSLQLGLRQGAFILATNIHHVGYAGSCNDNGSTFGACFRSTIVVIKTASEESTSGHAANKTAASNGVQDACTPERTLSLESIVPYPFLRVRRSYADYACRKLLTKWMESFHVPETEQAKLPSLDNLMQALHGNQSRKSTTRNGYAEFFDHGLEHDCVLNNDKMGEGCCHLSAHERRNASLPRLLCLEEIRDASFTALKSRLHMYLASPACNMRVGWTASVVLSTCELGKVTDVDVHMDPARQNSVYVGGMTDASLTEGSLQMQLSNGNVKLPAISADGVTLASCTNTCFTLAKLRSVSVSCMCIGILSNESLSDSSNLRMKPLPPYQTAVDQSKEKMGACSIVEIGGRMFLASVSLNCEHFLSVPSHVSNDAKGAVRTDATPNTGTTCSMQNCLDPNRPPPDDSLFVVGLLTRKFFRLTKTKSGEYSGCTLTVSNGSFQSGATPSPEDVSCLQSIDVKPGFAIDESKRRYLRQSLESILWTNISDDQLSLALVWWKLGSDERTCALLGCGWDELVSAPSVEARSVGVLVRIPLSVVQYDTKRGYARFRCQFDDLSASLQLFSRESCLKTEHRKRPLLDFVCSGRILPGMLDSRPRRMKYGGKASNCAQQEGELFATPHSSGIPTCTLADLSWAICSDLKNNSRKMVAPSLVREVKGANFLGVNFCSVQATCSKCYSNLCDNTAVKKKRKPDRIVVKQRSFWNDPLPIGHYKNVDLVPSKPTLESAPTKQNQRPQHTTMLCCPENCNVKQYGRIKWECSGTIDDGTGQAKLYADCDAAVLLLGMDAATVQAIEAGAWDNEQGVVFSKTFPPKEWLHQAVLTAMHLARERHLRSKHALTDQDALQFLSISARAEYLLQRHCRTSARPTRDLNYYVRCKPLAPNVTLGQTKVEIAVPGARGSALKRDVATYSLPPLKLHLVDCGPACSDLYQSWERLVGGAKAEAPSEKVPASLNAQALV